MRTRFLVSISISFEATIQTDLSTRIIEWDASAAAGLP